MNDAHSNDSKQAEMPSPDTARRPRSATRKILGCLVFSTALAVAFVLGLMWTEMRNFAVNLGGPHVYSDHRVRTRIENRVCELPDDAHHLYYALRGFQDPDDFAAFTVAENDFPVVLERVRGHFAAGDKAQASTQSYLAEHGPGSWEGRHRDANWDLAKYSDIVIEETRSTTIAYSPGAHRIFVCVWGGF